MCLAIPGKVIEIKEDEITLDYGSEKRTVNINIVDDLKVGDYAIVSNKIIVAKVPEKQAEEFMELLK
jgi:hydrogenase expression/formation protein HypC